MTSCDRLRLGAATLFLALLAFASCTNPDKPKNGTNGQNPQPPGPAATDQHSSYDNTPREFDQEDRIYLESADYPEKIGSVVIFPHKKHSHEIGVSCYWCHHQDLEGEKPRGCTKCHPTKKGELGPDNAPPTEDAFHERCIGCHRDRNRIDPNLNVAIECTDCHINNDKAQAKVEDAK